MLTMAMTTPHDSSTIGHASARPATHVTATGDASRVALPSRAWTVLALVLTDLLALAAALAVAFVARELAGGHESVVVLEFAFVVLLVPCTFALAGLYPAVAMSPVDEFRRMTIVVFTVFTLVAAGIAIVAGTASIGAIVVAAAFALVALPIARSVTRELCATRAWWGVPVVILGAGRTAEAILERLASSPRVGMRPIACLDDDVDKVGRSVRGVPVAGPLEDVVRYQRMGVRHVLVAMPALEPERLVSLIARYGRGFPAMILVPNLFGVASVGVGTRDLGGVLGLFVKHNLLSRVNRAVKVCVDAVLLVPALILGVPVIGLAALAVMVVSPGNPFYAQQRDGLGGRTIRVWKLRTMYKDAEALLERHLAADPEARAQWERHFKLDHDPRILPAVGTFLRISSLDELPQIFNVLRGDMSFVGPRPFPRYHLDAFSTGFRELRAMVRPGITGLWQVSARSDGDLKVQEDLDTYYVRNWSIWMDLYVLARTPVAVLFARGAR